MSLPKKSPGHRPGLFFALLVGQNRAGSLPYTCSVERCEQKCVNGTSVMVRVIQLQRLAVISSYCSKDQDPTGVVDADR